jgi:hypothetical protein
MAYVPVEVRRVNIPRRVAAGFVIAISSFWWRRWSSRSLSTACRRG